MTQIRIVASSEDVSYEVYCAVLDTMDGAQVVQAFQFSFPSQLSKLFGNIKSFVDTLVEDLKIGVQDVIKAFKQKDMFALLKAVAFDVRVLFKAVTAFTSLIPKGLMKVFESLEKNGWLDKLRNGTAKIDDVLSEHPLLKKLTGIALAGFLLWAWMNTSFVGDPAFDFDMVSILMALKGQYTITDLLTSPAGLSSMALLGTGLVTGMSFVWLSNEIYNLLIALTYSGAKLASQSGLANKLKSMIPKKRVTSNRVEAIPEWEKPCWLYALEQVTNASEAKIKKVMLKYGWDGKSFGASAQNTVSALSELTNKEISFEGTREACLLTARQFSGTRPKGKGLVFTKGHVMPFVNGKVSNFNGHGEEMVMFICTIK